MQRVARLAGWKFAWGLAWIAVVGLMGLTIAEMANYGEIVQFYGHTLMFGWEVEQPQHHYRIYLTTQALMSPEPTETCSTLYREEPTLEIETSPGYAYRMKVQAVSAAGNESEFSTESPLYLCLGSSNPSGKGNQVFLPNETALGPSYPNPFNSATTIPYTIASADGAPVAVTLQIYNLLGRVVRVLVDDDCYPGQYRTVWNGRNNQGAFVSAGTYICLLKAGDFSDTRLLVFAK